MENIGEKSFLQGLVIDSILSLGERLTPTVGNIDTLAVGPVQAGSSPSFTSS
ncbi:hypothetical protein ACUKBL_05250 [Furfurilactobacillus rossiae]